MVGAQMRETKHQRYANSEIIGHKQNGSARISYESKMDSNSDWTRKTICGIAELINGIQNFGNLTEMHTTQFFSEDVSTNTTRMGNILNENMNNSERPPRKGRNSASRKSIRVILRKPFSASPANDWLLCTKKSFGPRGSKLGVRVNYSKIRLQNTVEWT